WRYPASCPSFPPRRAPSDAPRRSSASIQLTSSRSCVSRRLGARGRQVRELAEMTKSPLFVHEVGPRDGLQNEPCFVPTAQKIELIDALSQTGVSKIEVTSFVSPRAIPALADAEAVMRGIKRVPHVC